MPARNKKSWPWRLIALVMAFATLAAWACSVPVFRYALEKWPSDPYQAIVFHRGPLTEAQQTLARNLGASGTAGSLHANLAVHTVDLAQNPDPKFLEVWQSLKIDTLPWLVVKYPTPTALRNPLCSAPLTEATVDQMIDSPARKEITERLAQGESAVWVLLESGNQQKDDATATLLDERLTYLTATLKLPKLEAQDIADKLVSVPEEDLKLEFSSYRLSRKNKDEQVFINMLLGIEADLKDTREPIIFPVFGRGRALYALVGKGIKNETIDLAAMFMIGKCSCQVKELNPGTDLLLAADWDTLIKSPLDRNLPIFAAAPGSGPETVTISGKATIYPRPSDEMEMYRRKTLSPLHIVVGASVVLVAGVAAVMLLSAALTFLRRK